MTFSIPHLTFICCKGHREMDGPVESETAGACALCQRILSPENDGGDFEAISVCGDCKFLFLEDSGTPAHDIHRRTPRVRETTYSNSSESIENLFSHHFSNMVNLARHNQTTVSDNESQSVDSVQRSSSRTTPSRSRRRRIVLSDTESDGYDSVYGDSDVISYGAYGVDSDASVEAHSFLDNDALVHASIVDSDTDIDPMHAGLNQWISDNEDDDDEWEEDEADNNTLESLVARVQLRRSLATNGRNHPVNWLTEIRSPEIGGGVLIRMSDRRQMHIPNLFGNSEEDQYVGNSGDYLDAREFEELLERLAETDSSRRGAPPAAVSFVNNLERVIVNEGDDYNGSACAVCKDVLSVGSVVNRLPCLHVYHPTCIMPWLGARNTCPVCRYELPTDDKDYEKRKRMSSRTHEMQNQGAVNEEDDDDDTSSEEEEDGEIMVNNDGGGRGRWFVIAAPIVGLVGIALVLWLGSPGADVRGLFGQGQAIRTSASSCPPTQRDNRSRRWWSLF